MRELSKLNCKHAEKPVDSRDNLYRIFRPSNYRAELRSLSQIPYYSQLPTQCQQQIREWEVCCGWMLIASFTFCRSISSPDPDWQACDSSYGRLPRRCGLGSRREGCLLSHTGMFGKVKHYITETLFQILCDSLPSRL
jgi:hypothetical protein